MTGIPCNGPFGAPKEVVGNAQLRKPQALKKKRPQPGTVLSGRPAVPASTFLIWDLTEWSGGSSAEEMTTQAGASSSQPERQFQRKTPWVDSAYASDFFFPYNHHPPPPRQTPPGRPTREGSISVRFGSVWLRFGPVWFRFGIPPVQKRDAQRGHTPTILQESTKTLDDNPPRSNFGSPCTPAGVCW